MRIAVVGSGVSGLVCAHLLAPEHEVTLYESASSFGGHAHTITVELDGRALAVDTGFMVYNERNYPVLTRLFAEWGIVTRPSDMSFAMADDAADVEWCGSGLLSLFAQPSNLVRPNFWRMLRDVARFNRAALALLDAPDAPDAPDESLGDFLRRGSFSASFVDWYLVPMGAAIWSADPSQFLDFPVAAFARFFANHGLLQLRDRPQWRTVVGGSVTYVEQVVRALGERARHDAVRRVTRRGEGVEVETEGGRELFDHVILACHSDEALALLDSPRELEREILSAISYRDNEAVVHTDARLMPRRPRARASWNWRRQPDNPAPTLTYDLTRLQGLEGPRRLYLTLNQSDAVDPDQVLARLHFRHPVFDAAAMAAQRRHDEISGVDGVSFAGAYWGYGFHEDGARSAERVCASLSAATRVDA